MISFVQRNLNHCKVAQDLLMQYIFEQKVNITLISDPYKVDLQSTRWHADCGLSRATIFVPSNDITEANVLHDPEFVPVALNGVQVLSCYASLNRRQDVYNNFLQRLENSVKSIQTGVPVLVTTARSAAWVSNSRGEELGALLDTLDLLIINTGSVPTFSRGAGSVVDITAASEMLAQRINSWRVMSDVFNNIDHHYVQFTLGKTRLREPQATPIESTGWVTPGGIDLDSLLTGILVTGWIDPTPIDKLEPNRAAVALEKLITAACDFSMPKRRTPRSGKPLVHWWNNEIAKLR